MRICYVDESGDTANLTDAVCNIQPVFVPAAVVLQQALLSATTIEFLRLKQTFFPGQIPKTGHYLDSMAEIKGADLRRNLRAGPRKVVRQTIGFLDHFVDLLERQHARIVGRVWIKGIGRPIDHAAIYTSSVQSIFGSFQHLLTREDDTGIVIADSRRKPQNRQVAHSIFTQKFRLSGDHYDRVLEMPTYGHSENHVGLQIADLLCSALLFPMAVHAYCSGHLTNLHLDPAYAVLKDRFGQRLKRLQYSYHDNVGHFRGGITVCDHLAERSGIHLFQ